MLHGSPRDVLDGSFRYAPVTMMGTGLPAKVGVSQQIVIICPTLSYLGSCKKAQKGHKHVKTGSGHVKNAQKQPKTSISAWLGITQAG